MDHLSDDMLLAYVRQQQLYLWSQSMQEHLANCLVCQGRCAEYAQVSNVIEIWARSSANDSAYVKVGPRVMRKLYEEKPSFSHRIHSGIAWVRVVLPVTVMIVVLCAVLFTLVTIRVGGSTANPNRPPTTPATHVPVQITSIPRQPTATPMPTASPTAIPGGSVVLVTPTAGSTPTTGTTGKASIKEDAPCTTSIDVIQNVLHVCGKNFTPGTTVTILYQIGSYYKKHDMQVAADGTFIDSLDVNSCSDVPTAISAQSTANPVETAQLVKNIVFGTCQEFGKLRK